MGYVKSPFNYIGGKYKLLPQILPLFPRKISTFYDVFGGGCNVGINSNAKSVYYNDIVSYVVEMFTEIKGLNVDLAVKQIEEVMNEYNLTRANKEGFLKLREDYNNGKKTWVTFYTLVCHSFNNQFRFNNKLQYNSSFGTVKADFNPSKENNFRSFLEKLNDTDIIFDSKDFREVDFSEANENDLIYFDPPYLISTGNYNDGKRGFKGWSNEDEIDLYNLCDNLDSQGIKFALSNVIQHNGQENKMLIDWLENYKVNYIKSHYNNRKYKLEDRHTIEVLITNY